MRRLIRKKLRVFWERIKNAGSANAFPRINPAVLIYRALLAGELEWRTRSF